MRTRGASIDKVIICTRSNRPIVKTGMRMGNARRNAVASVSKGFLLGKVSLSTGLRVACIKLGPRRIGTGPGLEVTVRSSTRVLRKMMMANVSGMSGHLFAKTTSGISTSGTHVSNVPSVDHSLRKHSTKMSMRGISKAFNATPGVQMHNTASVCNGSGPL